MVENVQITPGTGDTVAADQVTDGTLGTAKVQYVKIMDGAIGGTSKAGVGSNGLKVDGSGVTQPVSGTVTSNQGTAAALTAGWPVIGGVVTESTAAWTSSTTVNSTVTITTSGYNHVFITLNQTTTITGGVVTFEISDSVGFTNAYLINAIQINNPANVSSTYTLTPNTNQAFYINAAGSTAVRVRLSTVISGTGTVNVGIQANANGGDPIIGGSVDAMLQDGVGNDITSQANGAQRALDVGIDVAGVQVDPRSIRALTTSDNVTVTQQPITKGTQGSNGVTTQDLKDAGRTYVSLIAVAIPGVTTEALISFTQNRQGTTTASVTSYTITSGKTLRVQNIIVALQSATTAGEWVRVHLRHNTAGATTASSALVLDVTAGTAAAVSGITGVHNTPIPDGVEFYGNGTQSIGVSHLSSATSNVESITLIGYEY